jgi:hypothetical protein
MLTALTIDDLLYMKVTRALHQMALLNGRLGNIDKEQSLLKETLKVVKDNNPIKKESEKLLQSLEKSEAASQSTWNTYENKEMKLQFEYPSKFETHELVDRRVLLIDAKSKYSILTFYAERVNNGTSLETFAKDFPYAIQGNLSTNKSVNFPGFENALMQLYKVGQNDIELLLLKQNDQVFSITIPLGEKTNTEVFAQTLNKILQSIKLIK